MVFLLRRLPVAKGISSPTKFSQPERVKRETKARLPRSETGQWKKICLALALDGLLSGFRTAGHALHYADCIHSDSLVSTDMDAALADPVFPSPWFLLPTLVLIAGLLIYLPRILWRSELRASTPAQAA